MFLEGGQERRSDSGRQGARARARGEREQEKEQGQEHQKGQEQRHKTIAEAID